MKTVPGSQARTRQATLPLIIEQDEDGVFVVECPVLSGCYSQGKTLDEALQNIQEVIALLAEEKDARDVLRSYVPTQISFHTITVAL
jgi:predicted RNase H-like HicB family nuclease